MQYDGITAFEARGLDPAIADEMNCWFKNGKFVFEYRSMDALTFSKFRTVDKKWWIDPSNAALHLWNIDSLRALGSKPEKPLVITEGEFDAIAVKQACDGYVVSVPNGANGHRSQGAINPAHDGGFHYLWNENKLIKELDQFDKIILATDNDEKGVLLRDELAIRLGERRCWHVVYPEGCKDANDVLRQYGGETLQRVIKNAKPMRPGFLVKPSDLPDREKIPTYSTGWGALDERIRVTRPELMVVTGIPGHGKGQWTRAFCFRLAKAHGWRTAFFTPEDPHERLKRDMRRFAKAHGIENSKEWMDQHFRISNPPDDIRVILSMVENEMEAAAFQEDCQVFALDPWNEISHDRRGRLDTEYIEEALVDLKRKARRLKLLLIIVAHPRKIENGAKPTLYDISGSANWFNKCDHGVVIYRPNTEKPNADIIVEKCKDHEIMGTPGKVLVIFDKDKADFTASKDLSPDGRG